MKDNSRKRQEKETAKQVNNKKGKQKEGRESVPLAL
jgi:hypothetical protein